LRSVQRDGSPERTLARAAIPFTNLAPVSAPDPSNLTDFLVADFNGDGLADEAAFDSSTGAWYVALSNGSGLGAFTEWTTPQTRWATTVTWQVAAGDFTGDGRADLVALCVQTGALYVSVSTGSGFGGQQWSNAATWVDFKVGNFTGHTDGRVDLMARVQSNGAVWVSTGFNPNTTYTQGSSVQQLWAQWNSQTTTWALTSVGDFNGDGKADVATWDADPNSPQWGQWYVWLSTGSSFATPPGPAVGWGGLGNWQGSGPGRLCGAG
jgi:hypothetical protein